MPVTPLARSSSPAAARRAWRVSEAAATPDILSEHSPKVNRSSVTAECLQLCRYAGSRMAGTERTVRAARRMTDTEALMWAVEREPALRSSFLNVTLLDRAPDVDRFRHRMEQAVGAISRLRQHVVAGSGPM